MVGTERGGSAATAPLERRDEVAACDRETMKRVRGRTGGRDPVATGKGAGGRRGRAGEKSVSFSFFRLSLPLLRHLFFPSTPAVLSTIRYISGHPRHCFRGISSELFARDSFRASTSLHPYPSPLLFLSLSIRPCECRGYRARTTLFDFTNAESRIARPRNSHPVVLLAFRCFNELDTFQLFIRLRFSRT